VTADLVGNATTSTNTTGNAATATILAIGRTMAMTGDVTWTSPSFNGSVNVAAVATIATGAVDIAMLSASGTASSSTYLAGNGVWSTPSGGSGTVTSVTAGTGMTQSGTSSINPTLNVIGGLGITANANDIALDLNELVDTNKIAAGDKVAFVDVNASSQSAICEVSDIPLSVFDNDSGWITSNWQSLPNISSLTALP
jgi:hypothetical protein